MARVSLILLTVNDNADRSFGPGWSGSDFLPDSVHYLAPLFYTKHVFIAPHWPAVTGQGGNYERPLCE